MHNSKKQITMEESVSEIKPVSNESKDLYFLLSDKTFVRKLDVLNTAAMLNKKINNEEELKKFALSLPGVTAIYSIDELDIIDFIKSKQEAMGVMFVLQKYNISLLEATRKFMDEEQKYKCKLLVEK